MGKGCRPYTNRLFYSYDTTITALFFFHIHYWENVLPIHQWVVLLIWCNFHCSIDTVFTFTFGERVSPVHQQVVLLISPNFHFLSLSLSLFPLSLSTLGKRCRPSTNRLFCSYDMYNFHFLSLLLSLFPLSLSTLRKRCRLYTNRLFYSYDITFTTTLFSRSFTFIFGEKVSPVHQQVVL